MEKALKSVGERLANDAAIRELINRLKGENSGELFRIWVRDNIDNPNPAIKSELGEWLSIRQVEKALNHGEPINKQLRNSFKARLFHIISM